MRRVPLCPLCSLVLFSLSVLAVVGCAPAARPGEVTITGGTASAARREDGGWTFRTLPPPVPSAKPEPAPRPWVIILHPAPVDPKAAPSPVPAPESKP